MSRYTNAAIVHRGVLGAGMNLLREAFAPQALAVRVRKLLDREQ